MPIIIAAIFIAAYFYKMAENMGVSDFLCKCDFKIFALSTQLLIYQVFSQN